MSFQRIIHTLEGSVIELSTTSFDDSYQLGDVFVKKNNKLGEIQLERVPALVAALKLPEETSSADAEEAIQKAYRDYQEQWFWNRLWLRLTQPIQSYKHISALIALRDLHAQYDNMLVLSNAQNRVINSPEFFVAMVIGLTLQFNFFLSQSMGFLSALFQPKAIKKSIEQLRKFEKDVVVMLEKTAEQEYLRLLQQVHTNAPNQDWQALEENINSWFNSCSDSLDKLIKTLDGKKKSHYQNMLDTLKYKQQFLLQAVSVQQEAVNQSRLVEVAEKHKNHLNFQYGHLNNQLKNLESGFSLQIGDEEPKHPNTYVLYKNIFNQWKLYYYQDFTSTSVSISLDEVEGLEDALTNQLEQPDNIKRVIAAYHAKHLNFNNTYHPARASALIAKASPETLAQNLISDYSFSLQKEYVDNQHLDEENSRAIAKQLLQYCDYAEQKKEELKPLHAALEEDAHTQLQKYNTLVIACERNIQEQKIACIRDMVFGEVHADNAASLNILSEQYQDIKNSEAFNSLHKPAQQRIEKQFQYQEKSLKHLIKAIKVVVSNDVSDSIGDFFYSIGNTSWKVQVDADFKQTLEYILANQPMIDGAVIHHLHQTGITCFYKLSLNPEWSKADLRLIYQAIEETKKAMLKEAQEQAQALVLLPSENQFEIVPQPLLSDALTDIKTLPTVLGQLRLELKLALKNPELNIDAILDYYQSLTYGLICHIEAVMWGLIKEEDLDTEAWCGRTKKEIESLYKSIALLCHPDKKSDANSENQIKLLIDIKNRTLERLELVSKYAGECFQTPEIPEWIIDNRKGCNTWISDNNPNATSIENTFYTIYIVYTNPGFEIGFRNKETGLYEQRRLPVEHEPLLLPYATKEHYRWVYNLEDQIKLKKLVASWGGKVLYRMDEREEQHLHMGYISFKEKWSKWNIARIIEEARKEREERNEYIKKLEEDIRESRESLSEVMGSLRGDRESLGEDNESLRKINETTRETKETTRKTKETTRKTKETTRKTKETTRKTKEITRKTNETTRQIRRNCRELERNLAMMEAYFFSLHPELKESYMNQKYEVNKPNNTNCDFRFYSPVKTFNPFASVIEVDEVIGEHLENHGIENRLLIAEKESENDSNKVVFKM